MKLLHICFRFNGEDYKGTALPVTEEGKQVRYIVNIPGVRKDLTLVAEEDESILLAWKDYDTEEESMLIEMIGKAIERAQ
ncbi:MAG: hypothetical protein KF746_20540 [Chitinophagaceae bacterium]|nr:hypothetical protein [Chitinophagaceae bacterium]